ncbi:MAG: DUF1543 domain-containing protein [Tatlockia sp.]|nr:DUF1543 domain-containing protein [Tatlockia sp.]
MPLFVIYIGGSHSQSLIELHDMRFVIANSIEETYDALRQSWWGTPTSLHLDAWGILNYVDGHSIIVSAHPPQSVINKLYFVNLGGYDKRQFTELHKNIFIVATDEHQAKKKAVQQISEWESPHRDNLHEVDTVLDLSSLLIRQNSFLHLIETNDKSPFEFTCCYTPIGKLS